MGTIALLLLEPCLRLGVAAPAVEVLRRWHGKRLPVLGRWLQSSVSGRRFYKAKRSEGAVDRHTTRKKMALGR
jgi:hypothetical protein